jgi:hypothetical protein
MHMILRQTVGYRPAVGMRNYLIEGVSATGKTSVCKELRRRGFLAINGDTDLAYQGDPETGEPTDDVPSHWHHIWHVDRVRALVADQNERFTSSAAARGTSRSSWTCSTESSSWRSTWTLWTGDSISDQRASSAHSTRNAISSCGCIEPKKTPRRMAS